MERESIVYGCIKNLPFGNETESRRQCLLNKTVIKMLPFQEEASFLNREMFSMSSIDDLESTYQTQIIHFGASYRAIEYEWEEWIKQFEELLKQMYWVDATVHLETELAGKHVFIWEAQGNFHEPNSGELRVRCEWEHEGAINRSV